MKNNMSSLDREQLFTLETLKTPPAGKALAKWLIGLLGIFILSLFLPWQQNIRGQGNVTAFSPEYRPQSVESAIAGRISKWYVREGQFINKGDTILTLSEVKDEYFDPNLLFRIEEQVSAKNNSIESKKLKVASMKEQISALNNAMNVKLQQAKNQLVQARYKLISDSVAFEGEKVRFANFENQYERNKTLYEAGNIALSKFQDLESKYQESRMKLVSSENKLLQSKTELINVRVNISGTQAEFQDKISKAEADLSATLSDIYESEATLSKTRNEYSNMQIRNEQYQIVAPQDGYLVKAIKAGIGETIKEGEAVATIIPLNPDVAVELYVQAMDVPLISKDRKVRVEFDGWPAIQFSGWPTVSVGTFGGVVKVIDKVNSQGGQFRLLIVPDENDEPWPASISYGSGVKGWVMLDNVSVWYEIWRQLNGFPPSLYQEPDKENIVNKMPK